MKWILATVLSAAFLLGLYHWLPWDSASYFVTAIASAALAGFAGVQIRSLVSSERRHQEHLSAVSQIYGVMARRSLVATRAMLEKERSTLDSLSVEPSWSLLQASHRTALQGRLRDTSAALERVKLDLIQALRAKLESRGGEWGKLEAVLESFHKLADHIEAAAEGPEKLSELLAHLRAAEAHADRCADVLWRELKLPSPPTTGGGGGTLPAWTAKGTATSDSPE